MEGSQQFDHTRRRRIYEYVEQNGAVTPDTVRRNVLVQSESDSKPARSGSGLDPSRPMAAEEFDHHVSILKRDGLLEERDGRLRVGVATDAGATTVTLNGMEATVRPARQEDLTGIVGVIETIAAVDTYVVASRLAEEINREGVLLRDNESESRVFFVATVNDDAVGWLHVEGTQFPEMDHTAELTLGVLGEYRDDGLGSVLMERGLEWARGRGYQKIYQSVPATNERAVEFLEHNGWSVEATREGHYHIDDELVDEIQLATWLDERS
ncbi:GNAT family N-acetyltransferase [Halobacteriales archaeon QH_10_65_19]|nr:MAG: GNAT family N-acetyltransferase [Halobacteriales archaeon QH_10_65_19]